MFTVITTITRPTTSIPWFADTAEGSVLANMNNDPLVISQEVTGGDTLTKVYTSNYDSYESYQAWIAKISEVDATLFAKRNDYVVANEMTLKVEESLNGATPVVEKLL